MFASIPLDVWIAAALAAVVVLVATFGPSVALLS